MEAVLDKVDNGKTPEQTRRLTAEKKGLPSSIRRLWEKTQHIHRKKDGD